MKRAVFMAALVCLLAAGALAQDKANFGGKWMLDTGKSKLDGRMRVESMTMTVTQTDKELKVETVTKRAQRPEAGGQGGGMGRGGFGGDAAFIYSLDGKETKIEQETPRGTVPVSLKAKFEKDGRLKLTASRSFETPMGVMSMTTRETWTLSAGGQTLTVRRETDSPRGAVTSEFVFTRN